MYGLQISFLKKGKKEKLSDKDIKSFQKTYNAT